MRVYHNARSRIIDAACTLLVSRSESALNLESVIAAAGISRPGFFYHFKNRTELLVACTERMMDDWEKSLDQGKPDLLGSSFRSVLSNSRQEKNFDALARVLLTGFVDSPEIVDAFRSHYKRIMDRIFTGIAPELRMILQASLDGLWFARAMRIYSVPPNLRPKILRRIAALSKASRS